MAIVRYATKGNATGAVLTSALIKDGKDYTLKCIVRKLAAADVGNGAGQTQEANGCLVAQIQGAVFKDIIHCSIIRNALIAGWNAIGDGYHSQIGDAQTLGWKISADGKSLYVKDSTANADAQVVADDTIYILALVGNS
jgi:hypothetical protein